MKKDVLLLLIILLVSACGSTESNGTHSGTQNISMSENPESLGPEGWVRMSFDITATGNPTNIQILDSSPKGIFDNEAIRALSKWKYKPKIVDGVAVKQTNLQVQLDFVLDGNEN